MFQKDLRIDYLLDFYGDVLPERVRACMVAYYGEDLSLAEIAEDEGISRQGVRHLIKKGEEQLHFLEEKLGLAAHYTALSASGEEVERLARLCEGCEDERVQALCEAALACVTQIKNQ